MRLTAHIEGLDRLSLNVKYLIVAAQRGLQQSVPDGAQIIAEEAKALVPVDTGRLQDAIHVEDSTSGFPGCEDRAERQVVVVTPVYLSPGSAEGFTPPYARRIELGFMGLDSLGRNYHQPGQPFMRPALDSKRDEAIKQIKDGIGIEMDAAFNSRARG